MNLNKITYTETLAIDNQTTQPIRAYAEQANTIEVLAPVSGFNTAYAIVQGLKGSVVNPKLRATERLYMSPLSAEGDYSRWNFVLPGAVLNDMSLMNSTGVRVKVEFWYIESDFLGVEKYNTETGIADLLAADYPSATDDQFVRVIDTESDWYYDADLETWMDYEAYKQVGVSKQVTEVADFALEQGIFTEDPSHAPSNTELILQELDKMLRYDGSRSMTGDLDMDGNDIDNVGSVTLYDASGTAVLSYNGRDVIVNYQGVEGEMFKNLYVEVKANEAIANNDVLQYAGAVGASGRIRVKKAVPSEINANPHLIVGVATQAIANGNNGLVNWYGAINDIDTSDFTAGDIIYFASESATAGQYTATKPEAPNVQIKLGVVTIVSATQGQIKIRPDIGRKLGDLHDVHYNSHVFAEDDILKWDATDDRWIAISKADYLEAVTDRLTVNEADIDDLEDGTTVIPTYELKANKGATNGYAPLVSGLIPSAYIPNSYDNYEEVATYADLPDSESAREDTVYVVLADETSGGNTSTYRWTGSVYGKISDTLSASEVKTLYESNADVNQFTDALKSNYDTAYTHSQVTDDNPHETTFAQLLSKPTTIAGFGIIDAYTKAEVDALLDSLKAIYGWESSDLTPTSLENTDTLALSAVANYDMLLLIARVTADDTVFTQKIPVSELTNGTVIEFFNNANINATVDTANIAFNDVGATETLKIYGVKMEQQQAENISYDNTDSDLTATDVKSALDELDSDVTANKKIADYLKNNNLEVIDFSKLDFEIGNLKTSDGSNLLATNRIRNKDYFFVTKGDELSINSEDYVVAIFKYNEISKAYIGYEAYIDNTESYVADANYFIKLLGKRNDNAVVTALDIEMFEESLVSTDIKVRKEGFSNNQWYGKKAVFLGDSITWGFDPRDDTLGDQIVENWVKIVSKELGMNYVNYGINSSVIAVDDSQPTERDPMVTRYTDMDDDADLIVVLGGSNDWMYEWTPLGTMADRVNTTFYGALHNLCIGLYNKYQNAQIVFMKPIKRIQGAYNTLEATNANGKTLKEYGDIIQEVCDYYSIPVLDLYNESMLNPHLYTTYQRLLYIEDGVHPTPQGHIKMANRISGFLKQLGFIEYNL